MATLEEVMAQGYRIYMSCSLITTAVATVKRLDSLGFHTKLIKKTSGKNKFLVYVKEQDQQYQDEEPLKVLALLKECV